MVREDKADALRWFASAMPLARTPQSKKDAQSMHNYNKKYFRALENLTPWTAASKSSALNRKYSGVIKESGKQVVVMLDANDDPSNPLFKGAHIIKP